MQRFLVFFSIGVRMQGIFLIVKGDARADNIQNCNPIVAECSLKELL